MLILELVYKALARSKSFSFIFILNFSLAIASLSYLQFFKGSVASSLDAQAKVLLGADLVVASRFTISPEQILEIKDKLPEIKSFSQGVSTISMIASKKNARLMEVVAINEGFPYYGGLVFKDKSIYPKAEVKLKSDEVWVYQEVLDLLHLKLGNELKIGEASFIIKKAIEEDSLKTINFSGFMPKIYISHEGLQKTQLLEFGSTASYKLNYLFQKNLDNDALEKIENDLKKSIDKSLRVLSPNDGRDRLLRVLNFVTDFLSLVSLVSFFLGLVGLIYLYSGFLQKHQKDIMILSDLGLSKSSLALTYILYLFVLISISSILVFSLMGLSAGFIVPLLERLIDFKFILSLEYSFFVNSAFILLVLSVSIGLPLILPLLQRTKRALYQVLLSFIPFISLLLLVSHNVAPNKNIGLLFAGAILLIIILFFTIGSFVLKRFDFSGHTKNLSVSLALKNILRQRKTSLTLFTAIVLCTTFFSLIPQVGSSLSAVLTQSVDDKPRFFVVDAKEEQIADIKAHVNKKGAQLENITPMIRGRIIKHNGIDFAKESQTNALKNRTVNLSYRANLKESEKIIQGREFSGVYDSIDFSKPIEISVEKRYAARMKINLDDTLIFDILGLELEAKVVNIRSVKWTEFAPNFFLILQDGALNDAPKTVLATISSGDYEATAMLIELSELFPTLTVVDVKNLFESFSKLVKNVTNITDKMSIYSIV